MQLFLFGLFIISFASLQATFNDEISEFIQTIKKEQPQCINYLPVLYREVGFEYPITVGALFNTFRFECLKNPEKIRPVIIRANNDTKNMREHLMYLLRIMVPY